MRKVLFVDRGGTLIEPFAANPPSRSSSRASSPGVIPALLKIKSRGLRVRDRHQSTGLGSARTALSPAAMEFLLALFASQGVAFAAQFVCPHRADEGCACRKPAIGLVRDFVNAKPLDRERSAMVGDRRQRHRVRAQSRHPRASSSARRARRPGLRSRTRSSTGRAWRT